MIISAICMITILQGADSVNILVGDRESLYVLDTDRNTSSPLILSEAPQSVGYDFTRGFVYYVDNDSQLRRVSSRSKDKPITLNVGRADINEVVVDWFHVKLYLVRSSRKTLTKTNTRGTDTGDIIDKGSLASFEGTISRDDDITIKHVEVDPYDKLLFINIMEVYDSRQFHAIASSNLNGGNLKPAISRTFRYFIAFTVDVNTKRLYVVGKRRLSVYSYQGERLEVKALKTPEFVKINVFRNLLYGIMKHSPNELFMVQLDSASPDSLHPQQLHSENVQFDKILSFRLFDSRTQRRVRDTLYLCDRQDCSHSCEVLSNFGDTCSCQEGKFIAVDGRTCQECGQSGLNTYGVQPTIVDGNVSKPGNFPWHTVIYHLRSGEWDAVCGGTLVSPRLILTAAHCVTTPCSTCKPSPMSTRDVMVALGKINRAFSAIEETEVKKRLKTIRPHHLFLGTSVSYVHDIAVLEMDSDVAFNNYVMPACVDFNLNYHQQLTQDKTLEGYVAGWGNTQECGAQLGSCDSPSDVLKYGTTTIISYAECFNLSQTIDKTVFLTLTNDKFCAGNGSYSVIQKGDSGGGLTFAFDGLHFVYGVVSVKLFKVNQGKIAYSFGAFTDVAVHLDWLKKQIN